MCMWLLAWRTALSLAASAPSPQRSGTNIQAGTRPSCYG